MKNQLENEALLGRTAQHAYDNYLQGYFAIQHTNLYEQFKVSESADELLELSYKLKAIQSLEQAIKSNIETGYLAQQQLNLEKK